MPSDWFSRIVLGFWLLDSLGIYVIWGLTLATGGAWEQGLFEYQDGNIPIFHLIAELLMATVTLIGIATWRRASWGPTLALVGAGMFGYSAINSMGWVVHNEPTLAIPMALSLVGLPPLCIVALRSS